MKKFTLSLMTILFVLSGLMNNVLAQAPEGIIYQAEARDSKGKVLSNSNLDVKISILQGSSSAFSVYEELHNITTSNNGMFVLVIGDGTISTGNFEDVDWGNHPHFLNVQVKKTKNNVWTDMGTTQLLSVPYALHAKTAETVIADEADPVFGSSPAVQISSTHITKLGNLSGTNTGDQDISGIDDNAGAITTLQGEQITQNNAIALNTAKVGITTAEQTKLAGISEGANVNVQSDWNQITTTADDYIKNKPTIPAAADGSETKVTAGTNVTVTGSGTTASPYVVNSTTGSSTLAIDQSYQGGIIFWLDATGQHGLIAATADQSTGIQWYNGLFSVTNAVRDGIGAGMYNTERIIVNQGVGSYAAQLCANYQGGGYGDWYLPSKYELNLLYLQETAVGGFGNGYYWSSTESDDDVAWKQLFGSGDQFDDGKGLANYVRAVRAF